MTPITVQYFAMLREQAGKDSETLELEGQPSAREVFEQLAQKYHFKLGSQDIRFACNDQFVPAEQVLKPQDRLVFIPPVSGG